MEWIKAFHIIAVISWMAGLLYLPRLFVYHSQSDTGSDASEMLKVMEGRLLRVIMRPAALFVLVTGLWLGLEFGYFFERWFLVKLVLIFLLVVFHFLFEIYAMRFARDVNSHRGRFYRLINEGPAVLMIGIVVLVVVRPF